MSDARMNNGISLSRKCSPLPLLYTLIKVVNSKDIYCCARLKLCGRNSKSFCHACLHSFFRVVWGKYGKQIHFNIQKKLPRVGLELESSISNSVSVCTCIHNLTCTMQFHFSCKYPSSSQPFQYCFSVPSRLR